MFVFGSEEYWEHMRLVVMSYAKIVNPMLEMHNASMTYDQMKIDDGENYKLPFSYMANLLAGQDPDQHASVYEIALASKLLNMRFVCVLDYGRQTLPGGRKQSSDGNPIGNN